MRNIIRCCSSGVINLSAFKFQAFNNNTINICLPLSTGNNVTHFACWRERMKAWWTVGWTKSLLIIRHDPETERKKNRKGNQMISKRRLNNKKESIDDLRKSRGLHSVSAYRHGLYIYRSRPAGVAQSRHAFVGGTVSTWARWRIPVNKRQKRHQKRRSSAHCSSGTCRSDSSFPQLIV